MERPVWVCPRCGARLITRDLWHSCGRFTMENLFAASEPGTLELARRFVDLLGGLGDVQVLPQKTRLVAVARVRFAGCRPRRAGLVVSFALHRWVEDPRILRTIDYGPRWRVHEVLVRREDDLDAQLHAWLQESHNVVGLQSGLVPGHGRGLVPGQGRGLTPGQGRTAPPPPHPPPAGADPPR